MGKIEFSSEYGNRDKIICLVGASGSGKTTIAKELEGKGYNIIHSYTTRQEREPGEWGHIFIKKAIGHEIKMNKNMIAFKNLYDYEYWATKGQYQGKGTSIYVVDPEGANQVHKNVKDVKVITIFLSADDNVRMLRMLEDGRNNDDILVRLIKDKKIFKNVKTDYVIDYVIDANREIEEILKDILEVI